MAIHRLTAPSLGLALLAAVALDGRPAAAKVPSTTLEELTLRADAIVVARVEEVVRVEGVRVAKAKVLKPYVGLADGQRFAFLAERTWTCDSSAAVSGEKVLLFLARPSTQAGPFAPWLARPGFTVAEARRQTGLYVFQIAHSGQGRMPILQTKGNASIAAHTGLYLAARDHVKQSREPVLWVRQIELPATVSGLPNPNGRGWETYHVPFASIEAAFQQVLRQRRAAY